MSRRPPTTLPPARVRTRSVPSVSDAPRADPVSDQPPDTYEIGYCKPPKAYRFKPFHSGNLKGRPKGSTSASTILKEELDKPITARVSGRDVKMSRRHAVVRRLLDKAYAGDLPSIAMVLKLDDGVAARVNQAAVESPELSPEETARFQAFLAKYLPEDAP